MITGRAIVTRMKLREATRVGVALGVDLTINVNVIARRRMQRHPAAGGLVNPTMIIVDGATSRVGHLGDLGRGKENEND